VNTDGNIIDFVVFGILHGLATKWYLVPVVAAIWFAAYYAIFRFAITRFNLKTPGRDIDTAASVEKAVAGTIGKSGITCRRFWRRSAAPTTLSRWITALPVCVCRYTI
jgi:PTS system maltose and glucose-specific IIC component